MSKFAQLSLLAVAVVVTTAGTPFVPIQPVMTLVPVAIIDGGTVSTLPKSAKARGGKVVMLRGRSGKATANAPKKAVAQATRARPSERVASRETAVATGGGSAPEATEMRNAAEGGLRVMILGPDGLTRTRFIPAAPSLTARAHDD